ncbi:MAG: LysR family transcriptional regulator, partial [Oscillospiraceae bacterium]
MIRYEEMQYLAAFAEMGTLSAVAEKYHISQPTVTRSMMKIEEEFALPLFERTKNKIKLNDNGILAAKEALRVIEQTDNMLLRVRAYDKENHRISLGSAAAIQIPELMRRLSETFPHMIISNEP